MKIFHILTPIVLATLIYSCTKDKSLDYNYNAYCGTNFYTYDVEVRPLLLQYCATGTGSATGCHDSWIGNYNSVVNFIKSGSFENRVFVIKDMPPALNVFGIPPLSDSLLKVLECWILSGYPQK